jgi:hypothetical protein
MFHLQVATLEGLEGLTNTVSSFNLNGMLLASGGEDRSVQILDLPDRSQVWGTTSKAKEVK